MNYTGRPSISGCRPVLSLYPTHRFCQYLLLIFITFTNSFLFNRAFSTNSRRALRQRLSLWERSSTSPSRLRRATARVAAPSVCFAVARILLAAAPTAPPCFRHWRRSSPLLLPRGGFGSPRRVNGFARGSPTRGAVERSETERLYEGEPDREPLLDSTSPSRLTPCHLPYRGEALAFRKVFLPSPKFSSPPEAPLLGELSAKRD